MVFARLQAENIAGGEWSTSETVGGHIITEGEKWGGSPLKTPLGIGLRVPGGSEFIIQA